MSDFLDRFGAQLAVAGRTLGADAAGRPAQRPRRARRTTALLLLGAVVAAPALAATEPWQPLLGRPELNDTPTTSREARTPAAQLATLGVLRRPQNASDRSAATERLLRHLGREQRGVRVDSIRLLTAAQGQQAALAAVESVGRPDSTRADETDALCLAVLNGGMCAGTEALAAGNFLLLAGPNQLGLVPDGVAAVVLRYPSGESRTAEVRDNFFAVDDAPLAPRPSPSAPPAGASPKVEWLNAHGAVIGPPLGG